MIPKPEKRKKTRKPLRKRGKSQRKKLVAELDRVFSLYIRKRDKCCVLCGTTERLQCGHLFSRTAYSTRWHAANAHGQCAKHNLMHEHDAYPYHTWYINAFGREAFDELHEIYATPRKFTDEELTEMITHFKRFNA